MSVAQQDFVRALLDPGLPPPEGLRDGAGGAAGARFDVYRNNVVHSLRAALARGFPAIASLLGEQAFAGVAQAYLRAAPPASPRLMLYGARFPAFLAAEPRLARFGYLPDVARLELALRQSYHAADAPALAPERLAGRDAGALAATRFTAAPATRLLRSAWPVLSVYRRALDPAAPAPRAEAEDVLITRPGFDPQPQRLPPGSAGFAEALLAGAALGDAAALIAAPGDPAPALTLLLQSGAFAALQPPDPTEYRHA
jgi:hypothetical protein